jgi:predicted membrane chloride channel (bestrophin family)
MSSETNIIKTEEFIERADNEEFVSVALNFDGCIRLEFESDNINHAIADYFRYRHKDVPKLAEFKEFAKDVKYLLGRGCKIVNFEVNYKGSIRNRIKTWARKHVLKKLMEKCNG